MSEEINDEGHLRKYLLGELPEAEQQTLEERLLTDDELFDLLLVAEDELIDDYLSGALSASERGRFDGFFLLTPERRRKLSFAMALRRYITTEAATEAPAAEPATVKPSPRISAGRSSVIGQATWWNRAFSSPYLRMAAAAVIVLAVGLATWRAYVYFRQPQVSKGIASLREAYRDQRPTEARITELNYAPPPPTTRGRERDKFDYVALDRAKALIQLEANEHPSAQSYHDLGRLYLAQGDFDKAIDQFEKALKLDERKAELHSDYGAALLEMGKAYAVKGEKGKSLEEFAKSLDELSKAIETDNSLLEALFTRALLYEYMALPKQAEGDWRRYLEKDPGSRWADEARRHIKVLEGQQQKTTRSKEQILQEFFEAYDSQDDERAWNIICQSREVHSGKLISEQLLDRHLEERGVIGDPNPSLRALAYIGELEVRRAKDSYTSRLAMFYGSLSPKQTEILTAARDLMRSGHESYNRASPIEAAGFYSKAKRLFQSVNDECESLLAEHLIGHSYRDAGKSEQSLAISEALVQTCGEKKYNWLLMRALLLRSGSQYSLNDYSRAIDSAQRSLNLGEQIGDTIGMFNALSVLIDEYRYLNNSDQALRYVQQSLPLIEFSTLNPIQIGRHYGIVASSFNTFGYYAAAVEYLKEMVIQASSANHPQLRTLAYGILGLAYAKQGKLGEALDSAQLACAIAKTNTDENIRKLMMANSSLQKGYIYREAGDWAKAIDSYNECIEIYDNLDFRYHTYRALKGRLFCYIAQGRDDLAKEELEKTLGLAEKYRSTILEGDNRNSFFEMEQGLYDLAIDFAYSRMHDARRAFEYSEESRARSLLDLMNASGRVVTRYGLPDSDFSAASKSFSLDDIQLHLPDQAQVIQYAVLDEKLFIWLINKDGVSANEEVIIPQEKLNHKIFHYLKLISGSAADSSEDELISAKDLFNVLIKPIESKLDRTKQLCVVADKALNYLPFGALISESNDYLVKQYQLLSAPSSSAFVSCSKAASLKSGRKSERLLSIGNPRFDRRHFPRLGELGSAAREAEQITSYYGSICSLIGGNATKSRVTDEMKKADVIHFALHSVADQRSPMRSKLVLAKEPSESTTEAQTKSVLEAYEIYGLKLPRARLVVLSACQTGVDRYYAGEGMLNIARPFLVAGVPLAVASLWPVESDSTAQMMEDFHRRRKKDGRSTVDALRQAQLDMLSSPDPQMRRPYSWAPFIVIGGYAAF